MPKNRRSFTLECRMKPQDGGRVVAADHLGRAGTRIQRPNAATPAGQPGTPSSTALARLGSRGASARVTRRSPHGRADSGARGAARSSPPGAAPSPHRRDVHAAGPAHGRSPPNTWPDNRGKGGPRGADPQRGWRRAHGRQPPASREGVRTRHSWDQSPSRRSPRPARPARDRTRPRRASRAGRPS